MFVEAIKKVSEFTRPIYTLTREYGSNLVLPGAATIFFVNELGCAITCRHVAQLIVQADPVNTAYNSFKAEVQSLPNSNKRNRKLKELEQKYNYERGRIIQLKNLFVNCVSKLDTYEIIMHPALDIAIIKFSSNSNFLYKNYAVFLKDENQIEQGRYLCRLGYPFAEFTNYRFSETNDDIEWTNEGQQATPTFPIDGIVTRHLLGEDGKKMGIEMSTPGLRGQSGGPLFDISGKVYGMQSMTNHLHLGFDMKNFDLMINGRSTKVSNQPFLHVGLCISVNNIKSFLKENNIKFYEE